MMSRLFVFILMVMSGLFAYGQGQNPYANRFVAFDPPARSRIYFGIGDDIIMKIDDEKTFTAWMITAVTDSGFVVEGGHFVDPERVSAIKVYPKRKMRGLKRTLLYGGAGLPALMLLNYAISPGTSRVFVPAVGIVSGSMLITWLILKSFDWAGVRYKVSSERPLKMLILDMKAP